MPWDVQTHDEFTEWFRGLSQKQQEQVAAAIVVLQRDGPMVRRPLVGKIEGSRHANMKELIPPGGNLRILLRLIRVNERSFCSAAIRPVDGPSGTRKTSPLRMSATINISPSELGRNKRSQAMPSRPVSDIIDPVLTDPERRRRMDAYVRQIDAAATLRELRQRRGFKQRVIAVRLKQSQENVSRLERQTDPRISTLRKYIGAMGGQLKIVAVFEDHETPLYENVLNH